MLWALMKQLALGSYALIKINYFWMMFHVLPLKIIQNRHLQVILKTQRYSFFPSESLIFFGDCPAMFDATKRLFKALDGSVRHSAGRARISGGPWRPWRFHFLQTQGTTNRIGFDNYVWYIDMADIYLYIYTYNIYSIIYNIVYIILCIIFYI